MKKILYMIMCHKNLNQVAGLAEKMITPDSDVVIHIDVSVPDIEVAALIQKTKDIPGLYLTDKRIKGVLDERSLVDIVFIMLEYIKEKGLKYQYYALLSGQDYPIKPIETINREMIARYPEPLIDCSPYERSNWIYDKFNQTPRLLRFNFYLSTHFSRKNPIRKILRGFGIIMKELCALFRITVYDRLSRIGVLPYGGSAWWILPDVALDWIYDEYKKGTELTSLLLSARTPEEIFFPTMIMQSPVSDTVTVHPGDDGKQNCKTFAYFTDVGKPFKGHPYIISVNEFEKLRTSDCWFARKFDINEDPEILRMIDAELLA